MKIIIGLIAIPLVIVASPVILVLAVSYMVGGLVLVLPALVKELKNAKDSRL